METPLFIRNMEAGWSRLNYGWKKCWNPGRKLIRTYTRSSCKTTTLNITPETVRWFREIQPKSWSISNWRSLGRFENWSKQLILFNLTKPDLFAKTNWYNIQFWYVETYPKEPAARIETITLSTKYWLSCAVRSIRLCDCIGLKCKFKVREYFWKALY